MKKKNILITILLLNLVLMMGCTSEKATENNNLDKTENTNENSTYVAMECYNDGYEIHLFDTNGDTIKVFKDTSFAANDFLSNGWFCTYKESKFGAINFVTLDVIEEKYEYPLCFNCGLSPIKVGDLYGYINEKEEIIVEPQYENASIFSLDGLAEVVINNKSGYIDASGEMVIPAKYDTAYPFENGFAKVEDGDGNWYFINQDGTKVDFYGEMPFGESEGMIAICVNNYDNDKWGFINQVGEVIIEPVFEQVKSFSEGLAAVKDDETNLWGYIDMEGNWQIEPQFSPADSFCEGLAAVWDCKTQLWGFIDKNGEWQIEPQFGYVYTGFTGGKAFVALQSGEGILINQQGDILLTDVTAYEYSELGYSLISIKGECTLVDSKGVQVGDKVFEDAYFIEEAIWVETKDDKKGILNLQGEWIIDPETAEKVYYEMGVFSSAYQHDSYVWTNK